MSTAYEQEILAWRAARKKRLVADDGFLSILTKVPLAEGPNAIEHGGVTAFFEEGAVRLEAGPGPTPVLAGKEVWTLGTMRFEVLRRGSETYLRVKDRESARLRAFAGIDYFPIDPAWRVVARLEPYAPNKPIELDYEEGQQEAYESPGRAVFEVGGVAVSLDPVLDQGTPRLYVLFRDETSKDATYGAGRFLYAPLPTDGKVILDFNQAFNPPCAFNEHVSCPIVPRQNRLGVRIEAGEKKPSQGNP